MFIICGSGSFGHEEENERYTSPCSTPKRSKRNTNFCRIGKDSSNKNPYADRGLDKFYALLSELDDKKQKIYAQVGSDEISLVRFVYPNDSNQVKPIVVKAKERNQEKINTQGLVKNQKGNTPVTDPAVVQVQDKIESAEIPDKEAKRSSKTSSRLEKLMRHPYYYFPLILMMILLFLVVYGRSFAILCTSIGWYLIPTLNGTANSSASSSSTKTLKRNKESTRKIIHEKKTVNNQGSSSPRSVLNGLNSDKSPQQEEIGRRRSF